MKKILTVLSTFLLFVLSDSPFRPYYPSPQEPRPPTEFHPATDKINSQIKALAHAVRAGIYLQSINNKAFTFSPFSP